MLTCCLVLAGAARAEESASPQSAPSIRPAEKWIVDVARDYALGLRGRPSEQDASVLITLMKAGARLAPKAAEPYRWIAEIHDSFGSSEAAYDALEAFIERDEDHILARLKWIGLALQRRQTVEKREEFVEQQIAKASQYPAIASDGFQRLAEIALTRGDTASARQHIETALELMPLNVQANRLAYQLAEGKDQQITRVRVALRLITANPMQVNLVWQLANLLAELSLHKQAEGWYTYALDVHQAANPEDPPPPEVLYDLAHNRFCAGELEAALQTCSQTVELRPDYVSARLLMVHILRRLRRGELAMGQIRALSDYFAKQSAEVVKTKDRDMAAQMAWFYALYDRKPDEAMRFAKIAIDGPDPTPAALRAYGFAALAKGDHKEAERVLKDLAPTDQMAAVGLARVYLATKRAHRAVPVLQDAARLRGTGIAREEINQMLDANGLSVPPVPDHPDVRELLAGFDRKPLDYYKQPEKYLRFTAALARPEIAPGQPWYVVFTLENIGPFSVTIGSEMMISGQAVVSVTTSGDKDRQFPGVAFVDLARKPVLAPGESIRHVQTVDIGPVRYAMRTTPRRKHQIVLGAILEPVQSPSGQWTHRLGGLSAPPAKATRSALSPTSARIDELLTDLASPDSERATRAADVLACLLRAHHGRKRGAAEKDPLDPAPLQRALLVAATRTTSAADDAARRARIIEHFRHLPLTNDVVKSLAPGLSDKEWLVRLTTTWLFASKQGAKFTRVAKRTADSDPDPLVRELAGAFAQTDKVDQK